MQNTLSLFYVMNILELSSSLLLGIFTRHELGLITDTLSLTEAPVKLSLKEKRLVYLLRSAGINKC